MREFEAFGWRAEDVPDPQERAAFERSRLDWSELALEPHRSLLEWHRRLLRLRRETRWLRSGEPVSVEDDDLRRRLVMTRGPVQVACDFVSGRATVRSGKRSRWE